jgi:GT2 family glycosyltransferase/glycosyltransferase involved in cell wall biosynthesis
VNQRIARVVFASCTADLVDCLLDEVEAIAGEHELFVVSEFPPSRGQWVPYHVHRGIADNLDRLENSLQGYTVDYVAVLLQPWPAYRMMRHAGARFAFRLRRPWRLLFYNENYGHFRLHPRSLPVIARHFWWRSKNLVRWQLRPGGSLYTFWWRLWHPSAFERPLLFQFSRLSGAIVRLRKQIQPQHALPAAPAAGTPGVTFIIPSRNGRRLLQKLLPLLGGYPVIVIDNGSNDGSAELASDRVRFLVSKEPLSFAAAVNQGIHAANTSHVLLLNNDMEPAPGFVEGLQQEFAHCPNLFAATAQIFFPPPRRREETGKAVFHADVEIGYPHSPAGKDFPLRCEFPLEKESGTWVLYGSGGCTLYDRARLLQLGGFNESLRPAYCEDMDIGLRAWRQGWPTVFAAAAHVVHYHRSTTRHYFSNAELNRMLEYNLLRVVESAFSEPAAFARMWRIASWRLNLLGSEHEPQERAIDGLRFAAWAPLRWYRRVRGKLPENEVLALGSGQTTLYRGRPFRGLPRVLVAACYMPFPLSHGGAVRMFNLMQRAAQWRDQILLVFVDEFSTPAPELLALVSVLVQVKRPGTHYRRNTQRPDVVEEFDVPAFDAALRQSIRQWQPGIVQLEFTQMAQYAGACAGAHTLLVEHDITVDLYSQLLERRPRDFDLQQQTARWRSFETSAWQQVDCVVAMSDKDAATMQSARRVATLENGVDLERFQPATQEPEANRILFIGSFTHLPNLMALNFFLREVWPHCGGTLHIIAGREHEYYLDLFREHCQPPLQQPCVQLEGFISDVRPAYQQAEIVIAPLLASAGTNIKILEAMAMGKAIVSTPAGVNGLTLTPGEDYLLAQDSSEFAAAIARLRSDATLRQRIQGNARRTVEARYGWDAIAQLQEELYRTLDR